MSDLPPERPLPPGRLEVRKAALVRELSRPPRRRRVPRRLMVLLPAVLVLGAAGAIAAGLLHKPISKLESIECYAAADLESKHTPAYVSDFDGKFQPLPAPATLCTPFYARAYLTSDGRVPKLVTCIHDGRVAVFPGDGKESCERIGYEAFSAEEYRGAVAYVQRAFGVAYDVLDGAGECPRGEAVRRAISDALDDRGFSDFDVRIHPDAGPRDCVVDAWAPETGFDGRTIQLETEKTLDRRLEAAMQQAEAAARSRREYRCVDPRGRDAGSPRQLVDDITICMEQRAKVCISVPVLKRRLRAAFRRAGLEDWELRFMGYAAKLSRARIGDRGVDPRLRQVEVELKDCHEKGVPLDPAESKKGSGGAP